MKNIKEKFGKKKVYTTFAILIIVIISIGGYTGYSIYAADQKKQNILKSLKIEFTDIDTIEYGTKDFNTKSLVKSNTGTLESLPMLDTTKVGKQSLTYSVSKDGRQKEFKKDIEIKDSKKPDITFKSSKLEITVGDAFEATKNITSVKDPVDGDIALVNEKDVKKDQVSYYTVKNDVDTKKAGTYKVTVTAIDKNGNEEEKSYDVKVNKKEDVKKTQETTPTKDPGSNTTTKNPTNNGSASQGGTINNGNGNTSSGSKPTTPSPVKPTTPKCDINKLVTQVGNSGKMFKTVSEMRAWADNYLDSQSEPWQYHGYAEWTIVNQCGDELGWTAHFK